MKRFFALLGAAALAASSLALSNCAVMHVYPEVSGLTFLHGELIAHLAATPSAVAVGARGASHRLQLAPVRESANPVQARMVTYDPHGTRVVIRLIPLSEQITEVRIQAGVLGDEGYSRRIFKEMQKHIP